MKPKRLKPATLCAYNNYQLWIHIDRNLSLFGVAPYRLILGKCFKLCSDERAYFYHCSIHHRSELEEIADELSTKLGV